MFNPANSAETNSGQASDLVLTNYFRSKGARSNNRVDRVASDKDYFTAPHGSTATITDAQILRAQRKTRSEQALMKLAELYREDFGAELNQSSRNDASSFLAMNWLQDMPILSAEPDGRLLATWKPGRESVVIRFNGANIIDFSIAALKAEAIHRTWGTVNFFSFFNENAEANRIAKI